MNRERQAGRARIDAEIGRILVGEEELLPSSGFAASAMERVRQEAALPAPLPFPWKRAILILLAASVAAAWSAVEMVRWGWPWLEQLEQDWWTISPLHLSAAQVGAARQAEWVALALGVSLVSYLVSRRLAGRGGLL